MTLTLPYGKLVVGSETITVNDTAGGVAFTAETMQTALSGNYATTTFADLALITVEGNPVRWTINPDVTVTATTNGHVASVDDVLFVHGSQNLANFRAIRTTGSSGTLRITYFL